MVSVCAGCDEMKPWAGLVTGIVGGCFYAVNSKIIAKLKVDDPLDAVAVHLGSGFWGLIAGPLFKYVQDCSNVSFFMIFRFEKGIIYSGSVASLEALGWNMAGAGAFAAWQLVCGIILFGFLKVENKHK